MSTSWMWKEDLKKQQLTALPPKREDFANTSQGAKNYSIASSQAKTMASHLESRGLTGNDLRTQVNSSGGGLSWLTGLFPQSQNKTAEQSGDTAGPPSGEAAGAMLENLLNALAKHQASRSQPSKGESFHPTQVASVEDYDPNKTLA